MLTHTQRDLIKATVPLLESGGEALITHFYRMMLSEYLNNIDGRGDLKDEPKTLKSRFCLREVAYCASISTVKRSVNSVRRLIE